MSYRFRRQSSSDWSGQATGCALAIVLFGLIGAGKFLYTTFRPRPAPYTPLAPHVSEDVAPDPRQKRLETWCLILSPFLFIWGLSAFGNPSTRGQAIFGVLMAVACFAGWGYYTYLAPALTPKVSIQPDSIFPRTAAAFHTYTIFPPETNTQLPTAHTLMRSLLALHPSLTFEIVADSEHILWRVVDPRGAVQPQSMIDTIRSTIAGALVVSDTPEPLSSSTSKPRYRQHFLFRLINEYAAPIAFVDQLKTDDPLISITRRMDFLRSDYQEQITYSLFVLTASDSAKVRAWERLKEGDVAPLASVPNLARTETNLNGLDEALLERKLAGTLYHAFFVITIDSTEQSRIDELSHIVSDVSRFGIPSHNALSYALRSKPFVVTNPQQMALLDAAELLFTTPTDLHAPWRNLLLLLTPEELASLWHLPDERFTAEHIAWAGPPVPEPVTTAGEGRVAIGTAAGSGYKQAIYLSLADRAYHAAIVGKTGMGKSTLFHNLIHQDIAAGRSVTVIDPHGKLIANILKKSIPAARQNDVVLLNFGDVSRPVPLNPFRVPAGTSRETAFSFIYWIMRKLYDTVWRDRMDYVFRHVVQTLLTDPDATPRDISRILLDVSYRTERLRNLSQDDYALNELWAWYEKQAKSEQMEIASPILTRLTAFLGNRAIERMTCHPSNLDFPSFITDQKIVLINLEGDAIREEVGTLGAIVLAHLFLASERLGYLDDGELPRMYVYVDEVERIVTAPIPDMFSMSRKFGLSLTLANQFMKQLSPETLEGILGNVGSHFVFEVGENDSRQLTRIVEPDIAREELLKLGAYRMAVVTRERGSRLPAFLVNTMPPPSAIEPLADAAAFPVYAPLTAEEVSTYLAQRYQVKRPAVSNTPETSDGLRDYD